MLTDMTIRRVWVNEIDKLMEWRMEVLHHVFAIPQSNDMRELYAVNLEYYKTAISSGEHIAVFAKSDNVVIGCGGL